MNSRLERLRALMAEAGLDALYVPGPVDDVFGAHSANRRYISGFSGSSGAALVTMDRALMLLDFRYWEQGEREVVPRGFEIFKTMGRERSTFPKLIEEAGLQGKCIGFSRADTTLGLWESIHAGVAESSFLDRPQLVAAPPLIEQLRRRKDPEELTSLQRAIDIGDAAIERVQDQARAGQTEQEVALAVERAVRECGGDGVSFQTIVAVGAWGAMPHASPRSEPVAAGEPLVIDMGARVDGYCSDLTRTFTIGPAKARFEEIYAVVFEAQQNAIAKVEAGMTGKDADALARGVIERAGFGEQFGHGLGHGLGLEVHEAPYLGPTSEDTLENGMVFTIEPGIYVPGWGGVRIEDVVVLENGKARVLSHARKLIPAGVSR